MPQGMSMDLLVGKLEFCEVGTPICLGGFKVRMNRVSVKIMAEIQLFLPFSA